MRFAWILVLAAACSTTNAGPGAPSGLTVTAVDGGAHLTWVDNSSNELHFMIERKAGVAFLTVATVAPDTTSYHDATVQAGSTYVYRVTAMTASNAQASSAEASFTATAAADGGLDQASADFAGTAADLAGADLYSFAGSSCHSVPCRTFSSYCSTAPCQCKALPDDATDPICTGTQINCAVDPCSGKTASCNHNTGKCQLN